jgi:Ca2+-binding RTX toxin-like protein
LALLVAAGYLEVGCSNNGGLSELGTINSTRQADTGTADQTNAITAKWKQVNKDGTVGAPTSAVTAAPLGLPAQYQTFEHGAIISSDSYGAQFMTLALFNRWFLTQSQPTPDPTKTVMQTIGLPLRDKETFKGVDSVAFQFGQLIDTAGGQVVFGAIYQRYRFLNKTVGQADLGLPVGPESDAPGGARFQQFQNGEIDWIQLPAPPDLKPGATVPTSQAWEMITGDIYANWISFGRGLSPAGYPEGAPYVFKDFAGNVIGAAQHFQNQTLFWSSTAGVSSINISDAVLAEYNELGGPLGFKDSTNPPLGFPIGGQQTTANTLYQQFENGLMVTPKTGSAQFPHVFTNPDFYVGMLNSGGQDCDDITDCGTLEPYWHLIIEEKAPVAKQLGEMNYGNGWDPQVFADDVHKFIPKITPDLQIRVIFSGTDIDDTTENDTFGPVAFDWNIDNLWGELSSDGDPSVGMNHKIDAVNVSNEDLDAEFEIRSHPAFNASTPLASTWWSFSNFFTDRLDFQTFADTFSDVGNQEGLEHPFDQLFFNIFYKHIARDGNCFGMVVEAMAASQNQSNYAEPIYYFYPPDSHYSPGMSLDPSWDASTWGALGHEINIKQGYQLGAPSIRYFLSDFLMGDQHNPSKQFSNGQHFQFNGVPVVVSMTSNYMFENAHSVLATDFQNDVGIGDTDLSMPGLQTCTIPDWKSNTCYRIHILNPNLPLARVSSDPNHDEFIEINVDLNEFYYKDSFTGYVYYGTGTGATRGSNGRMFVMPYTLFDSPPHTPGTEWEDLLNLGQILHIGAGGSLAQASDDAGRTMFEQNAGSGRPKWDDLPYTDLTKQMALAPMPYFGADTVQEVQGYVASNVTGRTQSYVFTLAPGQVDGTSYEVDIQHAEQSSAFIIPGNLGKIDKVTTANIGTESKSTELAIADDGVTKAVKWTIGGVEKHRWAEFGEMTMMPAQRIQMHTEHVGYRIQINNIGPATSSHVRVSSGPGAVPVDLGTIPIPTGASTLDFQFPQVSISVTNQVAGKGGWLVAPVTVSLSATDFSGKGTVIEWSNDQVTWNTYSAPFQYAQQGPTTIYYRATDGDGNVSPVQQVAIKIDSQQPTTTGTLNLTSGIKLQYTASDPTPGSGLSLVHTQTRSSTGSLVEATTPLASGTITLPTTCSHVEVWAEDIAGNLQTPRLVFKDSKKPVFGTFSSTITSTACTAAAGLKLGVTATDDCGTPTVTSDAPDHFPLGTTVVHWTATDADGNQAQATQTVTTSLADDPSCCPVGSNIIMGSNNNDTLVGTPGPDCIIGLIGQDTIRGMGGDDALSGGQGDDIIYGGDGNDIIYGGPGQDVMNGDAGNDLMYGNDGVDTIHGNDGDDTIYGGQGTDHIYGDAGNDTCYGELDDDQIDGGTGNDYLNGGPNHDTYNGGGGSDQCVQDGGDTLGGTCHAVAP